MLMMLHQMLLIVEEMSAAHVLAPRAEVLLAAAAPAAASPAWMIPGGCSSTPRFPPRHPRDQNWSPLVHHPARKPDPPRLLRWMPRGGTTAAAKETEKASLSKSRRDSSEPAADRVLPHALEALAPLPPIPTVREEVPCLTEREAEEPRNQAAQLGLRPALHVLEQPVPWCQDIPSKHPGPRQAQPEHPFRLCPVHGQGLAPGSEWAAADCLAALGNQEEVFLLLGLGRPQVLERS